MDNELTRLKYLFEKYFDKTISPGERKELAGLVDIEDNKAAVMQLFADAWQRYEGDGSVVSPQKTNEMLHRILSRNTSGKGIAVSISQGKKFLWHRIAAAAAVLLFIVAGGFWLRTVTRKPVQQPSGTNVSTNDVNPGTYKARLTLADGSTITIDSAAPGQLAKQGNTAVINKHGQLTYRPEKGEQTAVYNTIATNKGETYSFTLADGSKVWLNSASSVHFPVAFPGKKRRIDVTGEVYVEVAKNPDQPFIAAVKGMEVLALGTAFNISAYDDEGNVSTTLIEGAVKVSELQLPSAENQSVTLNPGQQTQLSPNGRLIAAKNVNIEEITAWKDGLFHFESADLKTILRQFARWYDVEVIYDGAIENRKFFGIVKRSSTLRSVLEMLQDNNIVFHIDGKKLTVRSR